jgi:hypothetical protein
VAGLCVTVQAETTAVSIRVEQSNVSDMGPKDPKAAKDRFTKTHSRTLVVFVTNNSGDPLDLKVKHIVFGRDMIHHDYMTAGQGEKAVTVKPHTTERVETAEAKTVAVETHFDAKSKKKVDGSGATIIGGGVQVLQGEKLVAEWYDPESLKEKWGKTIEIKPSATPAPKKK